MFKSELIGIEPIQNYPNFQMPGAELMKNFYI